MEAGLRPCRRASASSRERTWHNAGTYKLLILSQVILSLQLPFAIVPLVHVTSDRLKMGAFASRLWVRILAWVVSLFIIALNGELVYDQIAEWISDGAPLPISIMMIGVAAAISGID